MLRKAIQSKFLRNLATVATGAVAAQLIAVLLQPILRRLYTPDDFGFMAIYTGIYSTLTIGSTLRYNLAVSVTETDQKASLLVVLASLISFLISTLLFVIIILFLPSIAQLLNVSDKYSNYLLFLPLSLLGLSFYSIFSYWSIRKALFRADALAKFLRRTGEGATQISFGSIGIWWGLVIGDLIGHVINVFIAIRRLFNSGFYFKNITFRQIKGIAYEYRHFPQYGVISGMLNIAAIYAPLVIINKYYDATTAGYLDLTRQIFLLTIALLGTAFAQVLQNRFAKKKINKQLILADVWRMSAILLFIGGIISIIIWLWAKPLFIFGFGVEWSESAEYAKILVFSFVPRLVATPLSSLLIALEKLKLNAIWQTSYFFGVCCLIFANKFDIITTLKIYMLIECFFYLANFLLVVYVARQYDKNVQIQN